MNHDCFHHVGLEQYKQAQLKIDNLLKSPIGSDLLGVVNWGGSPLKELSESISAFDAVWRVSRQLGLAQNDPSVSVLVVGDGTTPRTGALIARSSAWQVTSIDPLLKRNGPYPVKRLSCVKGRLEDYPELSADIVVAVHSHATVDATRAACRCPGAVVSMPCCVPWPIQDGQQTWIDDAVISPMRRIVVEVMSESSR